MAATAQNLKDFFALTGNNPAVTNDHLTQLSEWLQDVVGLDALATADEAVDYIFTTLKQQVKSHRRRTATVTSAWDD